MRGSAALRTGATPGGALAGPWVKNSLWTAARAVPSLDLRFADTKSLVCGTTGQNLVTFTRASSGTFVGSNGVLQNAVTNLLLRSEEFNDAYWTKNAATITSNAATAPNGATTADKLVETAVSNSHWVGVLSLGLASNIYTISVYAKAAERTELSIFIDTSVTRRTQYFNLSTGALGANSGGITSSIQSVGNGWYRCSIALNAAESLINVVYTTSASGNNSYLGDGTSGIYLWGAQLEQSATVGEYIPTTSAINSAPRFDHNPTTGESLGLLVEEARTNSITNNTMVGAVAGTPGTNPTGWIYATTSSNGLTISIVGTGVENGINYIDYRFNGTTVASPTPCAIGFVNATAATGQTWTASTYWKLAAGTATGITSWQIGLIEFTAGGAFVTGAFYSQTAPTSAALNTQRPTATRTLSGGATVGLLTYPINIAVAGNTAIDLTIRIGLPQLEQGAFATSVIPTTTATVTRAADVASIGSSAFTSFYNQTEGTVFADANVGSGAFPYAYGISDGTGNNRIILYRVANPATSSTLFDLRVDSGGSNSASLSLSAATTRFGFAYKANDFAVSGNGGAPVTDTSGAVPSVNQMTIGGPTFFQCNGTIKRLVYWNSRLPNSTLQAITQ